MARKEEPFLAEPDLVYCKNKTSTCSECLALHHHNMKKMLFVKVLHQRQIDCTRIDLGVFI